MPDSSLRTSVCVWIIYQIWFDPSHHLSFCRSVWVRKGRLTQRKADSFNPCQWLLKAKGGELTLPFSMWYPISSKQASKKCLFGEEMNGGTSEQVNSESSFRWIALKVGRTDFSSQRSWSTAELSEGEHQADKLAFGPDRAHCVRSGASSQLGTPPLSSVHYAISWGSLPSLSPWHPLRSSSLLTLLPILVVLAGRPWGCEGTMPWGCQLSDSSVSSAPPRPTWNVIISSVVSCSQQRLLGGDGWAVIASCLLPSRAIRAFFPSFYWSCWSAAWSPACMLNEPEL